MPNEMPKEIIDSNNQSSSENLRKVVWVDKQTEEALNKLWTDTEKKFYEEDSEKKVITYKMEVVKQYLTLLYEKVKDIENPREAWNKLVEEWNTSAWIMAVQIALESLWNPAYDVGKIDGIYWKDTKKAVENFQKDNDLTPDGAPWRDTIKVLLEKMWWAIEQEDEFENVKVKEEQEVPAEEVKPEDLVEWIPEGWSAEFKDGKWVDKTKEWEEQEVTVIVKIGDKTKEIVIIVKIENGKMKAEEKKEEQEEGEFENVKVKEEQEVPAEEVKPEDLVEWIPEGGTAEFKDGKGVDKEKEGEDQEVTVIVKIGEKTKEIVIIVKIENGKMKAEEKKENPEVDEFENVKVKEGEQEMPAEEVKPEDLVEWIPEGGTAEFKDGKGVDKEKEGEEQEVTVIVKIGEKTKEIVIIVKIENGKMRAEEKKENPEVDEFENVKVKEGEQDLPEEGKDVEAKDLLENVPEWDDVTVEYDGEGVDKTKDGEKQEVVVVVKKWDEEKRRITVNVTVDVANNKYNVEDKEKKEDQEEYDWISDLNIEDLWTWDEEWNFQFKEWLIDEETEELTINDKTIAKIEEWGNWFGYFVENGRLLIWNFVNGLLNGNWVEFNSFGDEFRNLLVEKEEHSYWIKYYWEWENGTLKDWIQRVREDGVDIEIRVLEWETTYINIPDDEELFYFDLEKIWEELFIKNGENSLKLKGLYSATKIVKILHDYKDKEWEFDTDLSEWFKSKKLLRKSSTGETEVVHNHADDLIINIIWTEWSSLASWLNEARKDIENKNEDWGAESFNLEEYWEFDSEWNFSIKEEVEKTDEDGKKYIEVWWKRFYKDNENGLCYMVWDDYFYIWKRENGNKVWHWIEYIDWWNKREWDYNSEGKEEWEWKITTEDGKEWWWKYENGNKVWHWIEYHDSWKKREWDYNSEGKREWEWTITTKDGKEWWWNYENGKQVWHWIEYNYILWEKEEWDYNSEGKREWEWKITTEDGKEWWWNYENGNKVWHWIEYDWEKEEWDYNSEGEREWEWKTTTEDGKEWWWNYENGNKVWHWVVYYYDWEKREWDYNSEGKKEWEWTITAADWTTTTKTYKNGEEVTE